MGSHSEKRRREEYRKREKRKYTETKVRAKCKANMVSKDRRQPEIIRSMQERGEEK